MRWRATWVKEVPRGGACELFLGDQEWLGDGSALVCRSYGETRTRCMLRMLDSREHGHGIWRGTWVYR